MTKKLELNRETLRELTEAELSEAAGGMERTLKCTTGELTQTVMCPSGATWFASCESNIGTCG